ncbi:dihydrofolate reductase [Thalassophryne amazonica]|uniref:dihydrofolate reductase n=1 Tax=Thalassophryne amazonica TaxID=390379 RepID=UPI0014720799|nr:dihydrofolate reductase [Thalassophryne amazonica]XP_034031521.1 dihydrofolate reductase [Thalassophryne amazonica]
MERKHEDGSVHRKPVRLIAAACNGMGIGKNGNLPWNLPAEFQYFLTSVSRVSRPGRMNMLVFGRLSWFSCPESLFPMPNVLHVVLSKTLSSVPDHAHFVCQDFESATRLASQLPLADLIETIWVAGGTRVYEDALMHPWCDLIYLTDIMADFDCDVFFPQFDRSVFKVQDSFPGVPTGIQEENGIKYKFQVYKKEICEAVSSQ